MTESPGNIGSPNCMTIIAIGIGLLLILAGVLFFTDDGTAPSPPENIIPSESAAAPTRSFQAPVQR